MTTLRVRVYVGADHRARVVGWESQLAVVVENASAMLTRSSGVALNVVESVGWPRSGGPLPKTLTALKAADPGVDVDLVLGLVDATDKAESVFAALVATEQSARHIVLRSFAWQAEGAALGPEAEGLGESARERLLIARRQHKQSVLLAYGIARLFGEEEALGSTYSKDITELAPKVGERLGPAVATALATRKDTLKQAGTKTDSGGLRRVDTENLAQVGMLLEADKPGVAWELLEPLLELYPEHAEISVVGCQVAVARKASDIEARCEAALLLGSKSPAAHLALAQALVAGDDAKNT